MDEDSIVNDSSPMWFERLKEAILENEEKAEI